MRFLHLSLLLPLAVLAAAADCGGGGGAIVDGGVPVDPCDVLGSCPIGCPCSQPNDAGPPVASDAGPIEVVDAGLPTSPPDSWVAWEDEVTTRVNALRAAGGTCGANEVFPPSGPLRVDVHLVAAARAHGADMAVNGYFAHESQDGTTPFQRMDQAGYTAFAAAENIAAGQRSPAEVVEAWRTSPGHCRNLYAADLNEVGVGYVYEPRSLYRHFWVQDFGIRQ
ncbi:MAG: CAP domain-containing protein [Deltaproteobacteria bacterium]|nr:CAP domain-containing protein [Deltaproteobacteria bacterium]